MRKAFSIIYLACPTVSKKYCTQLTQVGDNCLKQFPEIIPDQLASINENINKFKITLDSTL
jgi:hypothetical protein